MATRRQEQNYENLCHACRISTREYDGCMESSSDGVFERMMHETFPDVTRQRIVLSRVAEAAIFTFYMLHTPGVHADERTETFSVTQLMPGHRKKRHRFSCNE